CSCLRTTPSRSCGWRRGRRSRRCRRATRGREVWAGLRRSGQGNDHLPRHGRFGMRLARRVAVPTVVLVLGLAGTRPAHPAPCTETPNPHGKNVPPAGFTTEPGTNPKSGQNDDGFYVIGTETGEDVVFVEDGGSGTVFGPFAPGTKIKYTQAPGGTPGEKKIG